MSGNSFGQLFRIHTFGESHGHSVGVVIDGCPANIKLDIKAIQFELTRRKPGQSKITTPRNEQDSLEILSGIEGDITLGGPICITVKNKDQRKKDYTDIHKVFRPSHSDYTYHSKYQIHASSGGGRSSARETIGRVVAGAIAKQVIKKFVPEYDTIAFVQSVHQVNFKTSDYKEWNTIKKVRDDTEKSIVRCPHAETSQRMEECIVNAKSQGDTVGGVIQSMTYNTPVGLGDPVFDKLEANLAKAVLSIPACKGFDIGSGFSGTTMLGSEHNDAFYHKNNKVRTHTNHSGGIQGGISNGELIVLKAAFKPVSTIFKQQDTVSKTDLTKTVYKPQSGRHDPCVLPRAVPIVEAMVHLCIVDSLLKQRALQLNA